MDGDREGVDVSRNAQYRCLLPIDYDSVMDAIDLAQIEVEKAHRSPTEIHLSPRDYENLKEEAKKLVGKEYYGKKFAYHPEQFNGMNIIKADGPMSFIVAVEKPDINPTPGGLVIVDKPSRQDWQGATDDEINAAIKNCPGDTDHDRSVKAALLWVMDAVKNPHPLV